MLSTLNMALTVWDQPGDDFNHTQLTNNWLAVDQHDHSNGRGVQISTPGIAPGAIISSLLASQAVGNPQLAPNSVATGNIQSGAITTALLASGAITGATIASGAVGFAALDPNIISLGSVMLWYRGPGSGATPGGGWEIMDGRPWSSITNSLGLNSGNIPDMRGAFAQGADINGVVAPAIGVTGGSNTTNLAHTHNVNQHNHTVPSHVHPITSDGSHMHTWFGGYHVYTRQNAFQQGLTFLDAFGVQRQNFSVSMFIQNSFGWIADLDSDGKALTDMDNAGSHSHGGATQAQSPLSTGNAGATTDSQLGTVSTAPQYAGLLFIMRCR